MFHRMHSHPFQVSRLVSKWYKLKLKKFLSLKTQINLHIRQFYIITLIFLQKTGDIKHGKVDEPIGKPGKAKVGEVCVCKSCYKVGWFEMVEIKMLEYVCRIMSFFWENHALCSSQYLLYPDIYHFDQTSILKKCSFQFISELA